VDGYVDVLAALAREMLDGWRVGQTRDMAQEMKQLALRITSNILFGLNDHPLAQAIETAFEDWLELNHQVSFVGTLPIDIAAGSYELMLAKAEKLEQVLQELVQHKRSGDRDTLALLLQACAAGHITQQEVVGQATHLFNAAYHTTTYALTWSLFLLSQHPAEMMRVLDELETVIEGDVPTAGEVSRLIYLEWAIRESLRLLPPVIYYPRVCMTPVKFGNFPVPRGTLVIGSHYITHHMEEVFPEPQRFNPERWRTWASSPYAYIPFGGGPRMCLGAPFAMLVLKQTLALIFREFRLLVVPGARIERRCSLTLGLRHGLPMRLWQQDGRFSTSAVVGDIHEMVELPAVHVPVEAAVA
jgi:cytochrome P450